MISEKTVELNLTTELLNWLWVVTQRTHFVIGPTQREEARLGYDAGFYGSGPGLLIQFKKAHVTGSKFKWELNRTKLKDQHERLQRLEASGIPVFYAFPRFHRVREVASGRRQLLTKTFWFRPSAIQAPGGPRGHHEVLFDSAAKTWKVSSPDPVPIPNPTSLDEVVSSITRGPIGEAAMEDLVATVNRVLFSEGVDPPRNDVAVRGAPQYPSETSDTADSQILVGAALA